MDMVKVRVTNPQGHTHRDRLVEEGDILEVWPRQAAFLLQRGIAEPYSEERKSSRRSRKQGEEEVAAPVEESASESPNEGADETPDQ